MGRKGRNDAVEIARQEKNRWKKRALRAEETLAKAREWAERCFRSPRDGVDGRTDWEYLLSAILDESPTERETPADEWEYQYIPVTADGEEWAGRSREECDELIRAHADPNHWIHEPHNDDLYPVVSFRVERRRKAGPWMEVVPDDRA